jgi:hypothetical protein
MLLGLKFDKNKITKLSTGNFTTGHSNSCWSSSGEDVTS